MTLVVVKAEEVREGEPRHWCNDAGRARFVIDGGVYTAADLHTDSRADRGCMHCTAAIVDRPEQPATPTPDADERAFWCAAFCAELSAPNDSASVAARASLAGKAADAALAEYRKRWGAR